MKTGNFDDNFFEDDNDIGDNNSIPDLDQEALNLDDGEIDVGNFATTIHHSDSEDGEMENVDGDQNGGDWMADADAFARLHLEGGTLPQSSSLQD